MGNRLKQRAVLFSLVLGSVLVTATGCINQQAEAELVSETEIQTAPLTNGWTPQVAAGLSINSPVKLNRSNQRMDQSLGELTADIRSKIRSYESWDAERDEGTWMLVVNRISYDQETELDLDEALKGTVEDITEGLENACKPEYTSTSQMVAGQPGRRLSLSCNLPDEGPVYVEGVLFSQGTTFWQVQVAFQDRAKRAEAEQILQSVKLNGKNSTF